MNLFPRLILLSILLFGVISTSRVEVNYGHRGLASVSSENCFSILKRFMGYDTELEFSNLDILDVIFSIHTKERPRLTLYSSEMIEVLHKIYGTGTVDDLIVEIKKSENLKIIKHHFYDEEIENYYGKSSKFTLKLLKEEAKEDSYADFHSGWGWRLLNEDDPIFTESSYLTKLLKNSSLSAAGEDQIDPVGSLAEFKKSWEKLAPQNTEAIQFFLTGTDSNNHLYEYATQVARRRSGDKSINGEILFFDNIYGGGRGKMKEISSVLISNPEKNKYKLKTPSTYTFNPKDAAEVKRLEEIEKAALDDIRSKVESYKEVGGIIIETISGGHGLKTYRPEFLKELRILCDELNIPIFADEVLTGGGRTGKFFAYEHFKDFEPDFITFGKGLVVSGIAEVSRNGQNNHGVITNSITTIQNYTESLIKSSQVLNKIYDEGLVQKVSANTDHFLKQSIEAKKRKLISKMNSDLDFQRGQYQLSEKEYDELGDFEEFYSRKQNYFKDRDARYLQIIKGYEEELLELEEGSNRHYDVLESLKDYKDGLKRVIPSKSEFRAEYDRSVTNHKEDLQSKRAEIEELENELELLSTASREYFIKEHVRVFGYMIYGANLNAKSAMGRHFPPLTLTREQFDELLPSK